MLKENIILGGKFNKSDSSENKPTLENKEISHISQIKLYITAKK